MLSKRRITGIGLAITLAMFAAGCKKKAPAPPPPPPPVRSVRAAGSEARGSDGRFFFRRAEHHPARPVFDLCAGKFPAT